LVKDTPYLKYEDSLFCLDYEFAGGKIESGALWRVMSGLGSENEKNNYLSFWGHVLEEYIGWLFEKYAPGETNVFYSSPRFLDDSSRELCDAVVVCGETAILIEAKIATCRSAVRYSGDHKKMRQFLEDRLVIGKKGAVGVKQLINPHFLFELCVSGCMIAPTPVFMRL
jgi:hypothetical protein